MRERERVEERFWILVGKKILPGHKEGRNSANRVDRIHVHGKHITLYSLIILSPSDNFES